MVRLQFNPSDLVEAKVHAQKDSLQLPISTKNEEKEKPLPKRSSDFSFMILFSVCIAMWMSVDLYFYFTSDLPILSKFWNELFREKHGSEKHRAEVYQKILQIL
ncbi:uncharacterized protein LOC111693230 [Trichogramma pretiosum]|uniref:uncharacterized protein LOC111693230 n=1 Tax=Trichogramma pretiosum TaxID=7493 RepID=UPI000C71A811|nr:uncharacterized protein LOC111693230 [Trichogramma pretiosum]